MARKNIKNIKRIVEIGYRLIELRENTCKEHTFWNDAIFRMVSSHFVINHKHIETGKEICLAFFRNKHTGCPVVPDYSDSNSNQ